MRGRVSQKLERSGEGEGEENVMIHTVDNGTVLLCERIVQRQSTSWHASAGIGIKVHVTRRLEHPKSCPDTIVTSRWYYD